MLEILKYPDPKLKQVSAPVESFDASLHETLDKMAEAMYRDRGIGLAAPQVGIFQRIFIIDIAPNDSVERDRREFINPVLKDGKGHIAFEEGCLSIPGITEKVDRYNSIRVDYQDRNGEAQTLEAEDLLAVAIQHENDHLDGVLFVDRLSMLKRRMIKKKIKKALMI